MPGRERRRPGLPAAESPSAPAAGTFITEWTEGKKTCESFLAGQAEAYSAVAKQLARIASFYRFDGWLVNIENELSVSSALAAMLHAVLPPQTEPPLRQCWQPRPALAGAVRGPGMTSALCSLRQEAAVRTLPLFLRQLKEQLGRLVPGGLVLWYDSVLRSGQLKWQNELNEENR